MFIFFYSAAVFWLIVTILKLIYLGIILFFHLRDFGNVTLRNLKAPLCAFAVLDSLLSPLEFVT